MKKLPLLILSVAFSINMKAQQFNEKLQTYSEQITNEFSKIDKDRKKDLDKIADYIFEKWSNNLKVQPLFVCTHNSRRSHMAHIWFQTSMHYYGISNNSAFSGGTEATAFNKRAAETLKRAGFEYKVSNDKKNPTYTFIISERYPLVEMYSKKYDADENPKSNFFAVMVCSDADKSCPVVPGADKRFSIPYKDPRYSDNTASEKKTYDETCRQIAREMFYVASEVKKQIVLYQESKKQ